MVIPDDNRGHRCPGAGISIDSVPDYILARSSQTSYRNSGILLIPRHFLLMTIWSRSGPFDMRMRSSVQIAI
jgi:hypothetical protein